VADRTVLITGATSGLGRYLAEHLAVLVRSRHPGRAAALAADLGQDSRPYVADLAPLAAVRVLVAGSQLS
jgi:NAD(P)-dependent dehydrogenase (short-subunit alcohol dehydrogenase family)